MLLEPLVSFEHVTKTFHYGQERSNVRAAIPGRFGEPRGRNAFRALDDVSFSIAPGEAFGIIGPNGAGKSTILKILSGAVMPTTGTVRRPVRTVSIIELGLGFDPDLTGEENISYGGALLGMTPEQIEEHHREIIEFAELEDFATMPVKRYSTGMLARLGFALATAVDADLFVIDEVLSVGDWSFQAKSLERLQERHRRGAAVIFVSHNLWVVNQLCQRALLIDKGRVAASGATPMVLGAYLGANQYTLEHGGVINEARPVADASDGPETGGDESNPDAEPAEDGGGAEAVEPDQSRPDDAVEPQDHGDGLLLGEWRPVVIRSLELEPSEIDAGGATTMRATVDVVAPTTGLQLVASMFWQGYATFAIPDMIPSEFLGTVGTYEVEVRYPVVPASPSTTTWQLAVVRPTDQPGEDPEQMLPHAIERATADLKIRGEVTPRPGIYLPHSVEVTRVDD